ncbi:dihydrodipicolinate synthase family protein [Sinorhizobium meliloti]|uniref:dihydrodipicolinate synthase family protein n=1 Tax=Rhizobium meliloti TaxID=382 RepID=UPI0004873CE5|nr:dihydrodipicolinate synthase family protein [Sinorhizobium meliloti]MDE3832481.1 dihydrodipicolinate synthase family protein [Sinorhizobium meliloti]MDE4580376.1 dihydrodipicolinate synthase family protein [Sinorhizobium meliloti]
MSPQVRPPEGIWGAVLLPLDRRGEIEWSALDEQLSALLESGIQGVYTNGTAGEFHSQTEREFDRLSQLVSEFCHSVALPFQIGVSHSNARVARERLARVASLRPYAVQITLPDWWAPSYEEAEVFFAGMAATAPDTPLILYNPPHAKRRLNLDEIARLKARLPMLIGAKLPGGDEVWYGELRRKLPDLAVFIPGHFMASGCLGGGCGSYSNVACLSPAGAVRWWHQLREDPAGALAFEARVVGFMNEHVLPLAVRHGLSNAALDKAMAAAGRWCPIGPELLWPYSSAPGEAVIELGTAARRQLPELFSTSQ